MSVKVGFSYELTVDAYERKKIIEDLLKKETDPNSTRKVLLEEELTKLQLQIDMYEMHLKAKKDREDAEKLRLKKIEKEQNIALLIILSVIFASAFISFFAEYIKSKQQLDEASKPYEASKPFISKKAIKK